MCLGGDLHCYIVFLLTDLLGKEKSKAVDRNENEKSQS